jgi:hypothetical protein
MSAPLTYSTPTHENGDLLKAKWYVSRQLPPTVLDQKGYKVTSKLLKLMSFRNCYHLQGD